MRMRILSPGGLSAMLTECEANIPQSGVPNMGMNFFWNFKDYGLYLYGFFSIIRKIG